FFAVQQPEGIQQVVVSGFSNLDTCNHVMPPQAKLFDFGRPNPGQLVKPLLLECIYTLRSPFIL
ncbi:hypothetical protein, partial [Pseudomonas aeruginosa]|uniref:hypothetical protein n=1 Tax=Pseudomonas aeruginosa TaxID=287 RepID=UPI0032B7A147